MPTVCGLLVVKSLSLCTMCFTLHVLTLVTYNVSVVCYLIASVQATMLTVHNYVHVTYAG